MRSLIFLILSAASITSFASQSLELSCSGVAFEAGIRREINAVQKFETHGDPKRQELLSELNFNFSRTPSTQMNVQVRGFISPKETRVAATYVEIALEPLGNVISVFFERVHPQGSATDTPRFSIVKDFDPLQVKLSCEIRPSKSR